MIAPGDVPSGNGGDGFQPMLAASSDPPKKAKTAQSAQIERDSRAETAVEGLAGIDVAMLAAHELSQRGSVKPTVNKAIKAGQERSAGSQHRQPATAQSTDQRSGESLASANADPATLAEPTGRKRVAAEHPREARSGSAVEQSQGNRSRDGSTPSSSPGSASRSSASGTQPFPVQAPQRSPATNQLPVAVGAIPAAPATPGLASQSLAKPATAATTAITGVSGAGSTGRGSAQATLARLANSRGGMHWAGEQAPESAPGVRGQAMRGMFAALRTGGDGERAGSVTMRLMPEVLGDLKVSMSVRDGHVRAAFTVATAEAHASLTESLPELRHRLEERGLIVDSIQIEHRPSEEGLASSSRSESGRHAAHEGPSGQDPGLADRAGEDCAGDGRGAGGRGGGGGTADGRDRDPEGRDRRVPEALIAEAIGDPSDITMSSAGRRLSLDLTA
ncbi:MAG: flagellar hook-length control protein FliK [Phycisphaerales bacterium]|nr:flagellar hook-length control protein FliK [Phycisphaerales bacterium]